MLGVKDRPTWAAARNHFYQSLESSPRAYCSYLRRKRAVGTVVVPDTAIVLEGFPGSANSFAREAILYSNPGVHVASHIHTCAHILEALRLGRPTVLPIRPPVDAIASYLSRGYPSEVRAALRAYERMHQRLLPHLDDVVVAPFDRITSRFGDVVAEVNRKFGCDLVPFPHDDPGARDAVFAQLEAYTRQVAGDGADLLQATPTEARREQQAAVRAALMDPSLDGLRARCDALYGEITGPRALEPLPVVDGARLRRAPAFA
jgi:hypothetical protein